jgi:hypothetical protein
MVILIDVHRSSLELRLESTSSATRGALVPQYGWPAPNSLIPQYSYKYLPGACTRAMGCELGPNAAESARSEVTGRPLVLRHVGELEVSTETARPRPETRDLRPET